jgi:hypothetical protein
MSKKGSPDMHKGGGMTALKNSGERLIIDNNNNRATQVIHFLKRKDSQDRMVIKVNKTNQQNS